MARNILCMGSPRFSRRWAVITISLELAAQSSMGSEKSSRTVVCSASMAVFPVTTMDAGSLPSQSRFCRLCCVGAKCRSVTQPTNCRFISSG